MSRRRVVESFSLGILALAIAACATITGCHRRSEEPAGAASSLRDSKAGPAVFPPGPPRGPAEPTPSGVSIVVVPSAVGEPKVSYVIADPAASAALTVTDVPEAEGREDLAGGRGVRAPGWARAPRGDVPAEEPRASVRVGAQGLVTSFDAANFDTNPIYTGGYYIIPPDPNGAVGTSHLVSAVNSVIEFYTKAGVRTFVSGTASFFAAFSPLTVTADPKVVYDAYADRFVLVVIELTDTTLGDAANTSRIFVAVSDDGDPNGTWYATQIDAVTNIAGADRWIDFPGVAVDGQAIYITGNMLGFGGTGFAGVRLWVIGKSPLYAGGAATVSKLDPYAGGGSSTTTQPANTYGATPPGVGTFFVAYGGATLSGVQVLQFARIDDPLTSPTITQHIVPMGTIDANTLPLVDAPQSGSSTGLNVGDRRALAAVWRDDALWTTFNLRPPSGDPDAGQATAHWVKIDTSNLASPTVVDQGNIGGESIAPGTHTFYPSVAVSSTGRAFFGFSASAPTIFPGSYWTMRAAGDAPGATDAPSVLHAGTDYYVRKFGASRNRWGDYTGTAIDPIDGCAWVFNQYAMTRGTILTSEDGRWATSWGKVCPPTFTLTVGKAGGGAGAVTSVPAGVDCGPTCAAGFAADSVVTLTAAPASGSTFTGWSGAGCSGTGTCAVTIDAAKSVTANFDLQTFQLSVTKAGTGTGTVASTPAGINCGTTCAATFNAATVVTLVATPSSGATFTGWSGAGCSGTGTCVVTLDAAKAVTATFTGPCGAIGSAGGSISVLLGLLAFPTLLRRRPRA